ncbi:MAG: hypothetical protein LBT40_05115 [Deltaproteobacteria bacterium]|nr:hypothetical protein [Deltaproteobacteria bacterium]
MNGLLKAFQKYWRINSKALKKKNRLKNRVVADINDAMNSLIPNYKTLKNNINENFEKDIIKASDKLVENIRKDLTNLANEAFVHLVLFAFLQRVLNGGASIQRDCALLNKRCDIVVEYKGLLYLLEIKIKGNKPLKKAYKQLYGYMDISGSSVGWLIVFDKNLKKSWKRKIFWKTKIFKGNTIHHIGC